MNVKVYSRLFCLSTKKKIYDKVSRETRRQQTPTRIIVAGHYVGTKKWKRYLNG